MLKPVHRTRHYWYRYYSMRSRRRHGWFRGPESELFNIKVDTLVHNVRIGAAGYLLFNKYAYPDIRPDGDNLRGINSKVTNINWRNDMNLNRKRYLISPKQ